MISKRIFSIAIVRELRNWIECPHGRLSPQEFQGEDDVYLHRRDDKGPNYVHYVNLWRVRHIPATSSDENKP